MPDALQIGDIVEVKSGGPRMTVTSPADKYGYDSHISVHCTWFNGSTRVEELFAVDALKKIETAK